MSDIKTFNVKNGDKDKHNKMMSSRINDEKLLEKYITIWTKIEDVKDIELNALPVYDDRYIKAKIRTYGDEVYIIFGSLNVPEDDKGGLLQSFILILYLFTKTNIT